MKNLTTHAFLLFAICALFACRSVDLRTPKLKANEIANAEEKGRTLLREAKTKMGYDKLELARVYQALVKFDWKGIWKMMPMNAFPGNNQKEMLMQFATNSFDGSVEYLEGKKKGLVQGVQSWQGYTANLKDPQMYKHTKAKPVWGLATYHYLVEAPMHLPNAEIVLYAGQKELDGILYETVYITWGSEAPNKEYDRFLAYINPSTKFIDLLEVTISDFFLPMPKGMQHATARYDRKLTSIGTFLPSNVQIQLKGPKKKDNKVYSFALSEYAFDSFDSSLLYPFKDLEFVGTAKAKK